MTRTTISIHVVRSGDTLAGIAAKYRLSSWRAIAEAPHNAALLSRQPGLATRLQPGTRIHVPPDARALLVNRVQALHPLRAWLQRHFEELEALHAEQLPSLRRHAIGADGATTETLLAPLQARVLDDILAAHERARVFAHLNRGLGCTHLHAQGDLQRYFGGDLAVVGLNWLLTPEVLELWADMWWTEYWVGRWQDTDVERAMALTAVHLNLVRSMVLQQVDRRLRQAQLQIQTLDAE